jgi:hypothetical protein
MPPVALAITPIAAFVGLTSTQLIVGVLATAAEFGLSYLQQERAKSESKSSSTQSFSQNFAQGTVPRYVVLGKARVGGVYAFREAAGDSFYMATILSDDLIEGISTYYLRGTECLVDANGFVTTSPFNTSTEKLVNFEIHYGYVDQPASALLTSAFSGIWTFDHKLQGIAYLVTKIKQPPTAADWQTIFDGQIPEVSVLVRGSLIHDPREPNQNQNVQNSWKNSTNPALNLLYYFTSKNGFGLSRSLFAVDTFTKVANYCDDLIAQKNGGFKKRYEMGGVYSYDEDPADIAQNILDTFAGELYITDNGLVGLACDGTDEATVSITEDMVIDIEIDHAPGALYEYSSVKGRFSSEFHGYSVNVEEADPWIDQAVLARISRDIPFVFDMPYVFNHGQARRLMKKKMLRLNAAWSLNLILDFNAIELLGERLFTFSHPLIGIQLMKIDSVTPDEQDGFAKMQVRCSSVNTEALLWNPSLEEGIAPAIPPSTSGSIAPQTPIIGIIDVGTAASIVRSIISWTVIVQPTQLLEAQYKLTTSSTWTTLSVGQDNRSIVITPLTGGSSYDFQIRVTDPKYGVSEWASATFTATVSGTTILPPIYGAATGNVNYISVTATQAATNAAAFVEILVMPLGAAAVWPGTYYLAGKSQTITKPITAGAGSYSVYLRSVGINNDVSSQIGPFNTTVTATVVTGGTSGSGNGNSNSQNGTQTNNNSGLYGSSDPTTHPIYGGSSGTSDNSSSGGLY